MLTAAETITDAAARDASQFITMLSARPAQAYVRLVDPVPLPAGPTLTVRSDFTKNSANTNAAPDVGQGLNVAASRADIAIAQLLRLEKFEADWDGSEAAKPLDYSLKDARAFIRKLSPDSAIPRATLHADGHAILFIQEQDLYAELEFLGTDKIGYYVRRGEQKWSDEFSFDGRSLPEGLSQIGFSL
jgi:hypothetical protein